MGQPIEPPAIDAVWRRWEPRFVAAGVDVNLVGRLKVTIESWDQWCAVWMEAGDELEGHAREASARGRSLTAGELWARASMLHHFGGMYYVADMEQFHRSHRRAVEAFQVAAPLLDPPAVRFTAHVDGVELACYLRVPAGRAKPPVVLLFNGFEGTKEESGHRVAELLARGLATVSWDGPGRGETWPHLPMTGDYAPATGAVIDALSSRDDVDAGRVGALGPNRGGFVAAKAAAKEPRIRALAVTSPGYDRREEDWPTAYQEAFLLHLFRLDTAEELRERLRQPDLTLEGDAERIACPTLVIAGERDRGPQLEGSRRLYEEVTGDTEWAVIKGAERNGNNVPYLIRPLMADFLAERLGAG